MIMVLIMTYFTPLVSTFIDFAVSSFLPDLAHGPKSQSCSQFMEYTLHIYVDLNLANRPQRHQINKCISTTELIFQLQNATNSTAANATTAEQTSNSPQHLKAELMERQGPLFVAEKAEILHLFRFSAGDIWKSQRNSLNTGNGSVEIFVGISES